MSLRAERLQRLLAIRKLSEDMDRRALKLALAAVAEVEAGLQRQQTALVESKLAGRSALASGDRGEWLMADAQSEVAGWNRGRLRTLLSARANYASDATQKFLDSRREHEMVKQVIDDSERVARNEEERKTQAATDDWFLSRRKPPAD
jgi:hypothetical protein